MRKLRILFIGFVILIRANHSTMGQGGTFAIDGPKPATLEVLIDFSSVVVEATVESAYPVIDQQPPVSDFLIRVNRVVKGSLSILPLKLGHYPGFGVRCFPRRKNL